MKDPKFITEHNLQVSAPLGSVTAIRSGGHADFLATVDTCDVMVSMLQAATENGIETVVLGTGTRSVISDHGYRGLAIVNKIRHFDQASSRVVAGSGLSLGALIQLSAKYGLGGFAELVTYPGTIGGAFKDCSPDLVPFYQAIRVVKVWDATAKAVKVLDREAEHSALDQAIILEVHLELTPLSKVELQRAMLQATQHRLKEHPANAPAVRVFCDPTARALLQSLEMAGERVGGAVVSTKNPNYILNDQAASSHDIYELAQRMKYRVKVKLGETLQDSLCFIGEW